MRVYQITSKSAVGSTVEQMNRTTTTWGGWVGGGGGGGGSVGVGWKWGGVGGGGVQYCLIVFAQRASIAETVSMTSCYHAVGIGLHRANSLGMNK